MASTRRVAPTFSGGRGWRWARGAAPPHAAVAASGATLWSPLAPRAEAAAAGTATLAELVCRPAAVFSRPAAVFSRPTALPCATYWLRLPNPVGSEGQLPVGPREP